MEHENHLAIQAAQNDLDSTVRELSMHPENRGLVKMFNAVEELFKQDAEKKVLWQSLKSGVISQI